MKSVLVGTCILIGLSIIGFYTACAKKDTFKFASPQLQLTFPRDHAAHHDYRTEWWYYTGHLSSIPSSTYPNSKSFGYELTFFRTALALEDGQADPKQVYFAHFAITDESGDQFYHAEKQSRGNFGDAGASEAYLKTFLGNWSVQDLGQYHLLQAETDTFSVALILEPAKAMVLQGPNGYNQKGSDPKNASMYYSFTRLKSSGAVTLGKERYLVEGLSWHDHEFGSTQLDSNVVGWDWFSIQFSDTTELMLYHLRLAEGGVSPFSSGSLVTVDGRRQVIAHSEYSIQVLDTYVSKKTSARYPYRWQISIPKQEIDILVETTVRDQELMTEESTRITYWEGSTKVSGKKQGKLIAGKGYTELTGYAKPISRF